MLNVLKLHPTGVSKFLFIVCLGLSAFAMVGGSIKSVDAQDTSKSTKPKIVVGPDFTLTEDAFKDWRVVCKVGKPDTAATGETICQMLQAAPAVKGGPTVFLLSISPGDTTKLKNSSSKTTQAFGVVTVPTGVYLAPGIEIHVDKRRPFKVLYEICDQIGCHAGFKLSGSVLSAFKKGIGATVRVWTAKSRAVEFKVSLKGFTAAYNFYSSKVSN